MPFPVRLIFLLFCALQLLNAASSLSKADYEKFAVRSIGDASRGRALFNDEQHLGCTRCHTIEPGHASIGPELVTVGDKFTRKELVQAVLAPSQNIAVGYSTTVIDLKNGETIEGILKDQTSDAVTLGLGDGSLKVIPVSEIASQHISEVSLMPEGLQAQLSLEEFNDLIEFLVSLKLPANATLESHGMPSEIPVATHPVHFTAIHSPEIKFNNPVWFGEIPGSSNSFLVLEHQVGRIWRFDPREQKKGLFLDLGPGVGAGGTRGLIGFTFAPDYLDSKKYYFAVHTNENGVIKTITYERRANPDSTRDSGEEGRRILEITTTANVHYGGSMNFGADGYLYIGMGDTGPQEDPRGNAQDTSYLRGKILRIDVRHPSAGRGYAIPSDNPFVGHPGFRPEIWAYGFREPWRFNFDPVTGDLWVGDVGQDRYEEVDLVHKGGNYGWNVYEGFEPFSNQYRRPNEKFLQPVFAYTRKYGPSVTGGFVDRHDSKEPFYGAYIFGDYETRRVFALWQTQGKLDKVIQIGTAPEHVVSFGQDLQRNLYVVGYEGTIFKLDWTDALPN
jgi:putative heme-binding domain-containing protein